ncbi:MAG TPA: DUF4168 domain-containing protein [Flavobacteriaceae bacterium]|nr:DUF4168 domain-containing protein [Flavobacteriaceae bacterium]
MSTFKKITGLLVMFTLFSGSLFAQEKKDIVPDAKLSNFVTAFDNLEAATKEAQQKMVEVVKAEGLDMKRFNEIHIGYINSNMESDATPEELAKHNRAMNKIQKMQDELQNEMDGIVKESGLTIDEYQKIATEMQTNMILRGRYKKMANTRKE